MPLHFVNKSLKKIIYQTCEIKSTVTDFSQVNMIRVKYMKNTWYRWKHNFINNNLYSENKLNSFCSPVCVLHVYVCDYEIFLQFGKSKISTKQFMWRSENMLQYFDVVLYMIYTYFMHKLKSINIVTFISMVKNSRPVIATREKYYNLILLFINKWTINTMDTIFVVGYIATSIMRM